MIDAMTSAGGVAPIDGGGGVVGIAPIAGVGRPIGVSHIDGAEEVEPVLLKGEPLPWG